MTYKLPKPENEDYSDDCTFDCRGCVFYFVGAKNSHYCLDISGGGEGCTDFNKFQALPPIVLTKVTK